MIVLTIRSDNPEAEIGLFRHEKEIAYTKWQAHRELSQTIHKKIEEQMRSHNFDWKDIGGIVCYKGPGSFTGLRIGLTVGNALAYSLDIPVVSNTGDDWQQTGIGRLQKGENEHSAMPEYGADAHITKPRK